MPYYHWWPKQGTTEWLSYKFPEETTVSSSTVYWYDDEPWGGCRVPKSWKLYYKDSKGEWQPVIGVADYGTKKGYANRVEFDLIKTRELKLEIQLPDNNSSGIFEWEVE